MIVTITTINLDLYKKNKFKLIVSTIRYNQTHESINYKIVIHSINRVFQKLCYNLSDIVIGSRQTQNIINNHGSVRYSFCPSVSTVCYFTYVLKVFGINYQLFKVKYY